MAEPDEKVNTKRQQAEELLGSRWEFFFNTIKQKAEFRKIDEEEDFRAIDKYDLNSMVRFLDKYNVQVSRQTVQEIIEGSFVEKKNPIQTYFQELPDHDEMIDGDPIKKLTNTVKIIGEQDQFERYFRKWIVGVVANAMDDYKCRNHICLVLTGDQGTYKTSWLENLCPERLEEYIYTGKLDPTGKDAMTYIAEYLFVNIDDQLKQLNKKDENDLKELITKNRVKYRRPYDPVVTEYPHLASFMASVNGNDFLTDATGSRRFLPFEVEDIDWEEAQKIDLDKVYSQAKTLWESGFTYWITQEERDDLMERNEHFEVITTEEELVKEWFDVPDNKHQAEQYLTTTMIQSTLEGQSSLKRGLSKKKLGEALNKAGFEKFQKRDGNTVKHVWAIDRRIKPENIPSDDKIKKAAQAQFSS